jgi:hypothetical protein
MRKMQVRSVAELFRALACVKSTGVHSTVR